MTSDQKPSDLGSASSSQAEDLRIALKFIRSCEMIFVAEDDGGPRSIWTLHAKDAVERLERYSEAAPDMYGALKAFTGITLLPTGQAVGLTREHFENAKAALAKATGGQS